MNSIPCRIVPRSRAMRVARSASNAPCYGYPTAPSRGDWASFMLACWSQSRARHRHPLRTALRVAPDTHPPRPRNGRCRFHDSHLAAARFSNDCPRELQPLPRVSTGRCMAAGGVPRARLGSAGARRVARTSAASVTYEHEHGRSQYAARRERRAFASAASRPVRRRLRTRSARGTPPAATPRDKPLGTPPEAKAHDKPRGAPPAAMAPANRTSRGT